MSPEWVATDMRIVARKNVESEFFYRGFEIKVWQYWLLYLMKLKEEGVYMDELMNIYLLQLWVL